MGHPSLALLHSTPTAKPHVGDPQPLRSHNLRKENIPHAEQGPRLPFSTSKGKTSLTHTSSSSSTVPGGASTRQ